MPLLFALQSEAFIQQTQLYAKSLVWLERIVQTGSA